MVFSIRGFGIWYVHLSHYELGRIFTPRRGPPKKNQAFNQATAKAQSEAWAAANWIFSVGGV